MNSTSVFPPNKTKILKKLIKYVKHNLNHPEKYYEIIIEDEGDKRILHNNIKKGVLCITQFIGNLK